MNRDLRAVALERVWREQFAERQWSNLAGEIEMGGWREMGWAREERRRAVRAGRNCSGAAARPCGETDAIHGGGSIDHEEGPAEGGGWLGSCPCAAQENIDALRLVDMLILLRRWRAQDLRLGLACELHHRGAVSQRTSVSPGPRSWISGMAGRLTGCRTVTQLRLSMAGTLKPREWPTASSSCTAGGTKTRVGQGWEQVEKTELVQVLESRGIADNLRQGALPSGDPPR